MGRRSVTGIAVLVTGVLTTGVLAACGPEPVPKPAETASTSPVDARPRTDPEVSSLSAVLVSPREPAVPFAGSDGRVTVTYELGVHNPTPFALTLTTAEVLDPSGRVLQKLEQRALAANLALPSVRSGVKQLTEGQVATLYVTLKFPGRSDLPARIENRITVAGLPGGAGYTSELTEVPISGLEPPVLGPPLEAGTRYIAADSCCDSVRHRRALLAVANGEWLAQRFAVDWEQLDGRGRTVSRGDPADPAAYAVYGKKVIAAADGAVVHVVDDQDDQVPGRLPAGLTAAQADGNSVIVDLGNGLYALYAHLQKGSVAVRLGQRVRRGELLGLVGNSGNSSAPHLHFHVMDGPSPMTSEGVPYVIDAFTTTGRIATQQDFDSLENTTTPLPTRQLSTDGTHENQLPLNLDLVTFG